MLLTTEGQTTTLPPSRGQPKGPKYFSSSGPLFLLLSVVTSKTLNSPQPQYSVTSLLSISTHSGYLKNELSEREFAVCLPDGRRRREEEGFKITLILQRHSEKLRGCASWKMARSDWLAADLAASVCLPEKVLV